MSEFVAPDRVVILGCGSVAQCLLPLLLERFKLDPASVTVLESRDNRSRIASSIDAGVHYVQAEITKDNLESTLDGLLGDGDTAVYRPTVHYAYCPSDAAWASFVELEGNDYAYPERQRIMNDEIISGRDELGVLVMGHPYKSWWTGMQTTIEEARLAAPHQSATTIQVAASILGAVAWMLTSPLEGVRVPDELPWREVLDVAMPYVGTLWSGPLDWDPVSAHTDWFDQWAGNTLDAEDPWQFTNFLIP